ncbi:MAG TPA: 5'-nucleotidase [Armatimonadaceae bacterium]|nr:5'-nucleotidase [Armatimonadaceae bacterium]
MAKTSISGKISRRGLMRAGAAWSLSALALFALPALGGQGAFSTGNIRQSESEAGNLVADAVRAAASADVAFVPAAAFKPGATAPRPATPEQAATLVDPATDVVVVLSLQGKQIADALERSVSFAPQPSSGFLQVSGLKFTYDASKPSGRRLVSVSVGGTAMDAVKTYKVATTRPLANGQQGYFKIWEKDQITADTGKTLATALSDYARSRGGSLNVGLESRIVAN